MGLGMERVAGEAFNQILNRCWMSHYAMWFTSEMDALGIVRAYSLTPAASPTLAQLPGPCPPASWACQGRLWVGRSL